MNITFFTSCTVDYVTEPFTSTKRKGKGEMKTNHANSIYIDFFFDMEMVELAYQKFKDAIDLNSGVRHTQWSFSCMMFVLWCKYIGFKQPRVILKFQLQYLNVKCTTKPLCLYHFVITIIPLISERTALFILPLYVLFFS